VRGTNDEVKEADFRHPSYFSLDVRTEGSLNVSMISKKTLGLSLSLKSPLHVQDLNRSGGCARIQPIWASARPSLDASRYYL
jgi:hypothetical protein